MEKGLPHAEREATWHKVAHYGFFIPVPHSHARVVTIIELRKHALDTNPRTDDPMRHVLSAVVQNQPGVLAHVAGMLATRGFNIDSLAVGETENPHFSRMTFVVVGDDKVLDQLRKQLEKLVTVVKVLDISTEDYVERDLMLIKVNVAPERRGEIRELADIFRGRIVD